MQEATPTIYQKPTKNAIRGEGKKNKQRAFTNILDFCKKSSENFSEAFRSPHSIFFVPTITIIMLLIIIIIIMIIIIIIMMIMVPPNRYPT